MSFGFNNSFSSMVIISTLLVLFLPGCATQSSVEYYRPQGAEEQWQIEADFSQLSHDMTLLINGTKVFEESGEPMASNFSYSGEYKGRNVVADCHHETEYNLFESSEKHVCDILVNSERAANLEF